MKRNTVKINFKNVLFTKILKKLSVTLIYNFLKFRLINFSEKNITVKIKIKNDFYG